MAHSEYFGWNVKFYAWCHTHGLVQHCVSSIANAQGLTHTFAK